VNDILTACQGVIELFVRVSIGVSVVIPAGLAVWMMQLQKSKEAAHVDSISASACTPDSENYPAILVERSVCGSKHI
jgi:hypothetical protein